ncbi:MAG: PAS-domain containing protein [Glaciecola sp.]
MAFGWVLLALVYLMLLFWLAKWGDKNTPSARKITSSPIIYSLALAIYCTAWTFFGGVGQAGRDAWMYLPILLGPIFVYVFGYHFIRKMIVVSKKQHINTISDFISSRYGKRQPVALVVTIIALLATIPYIALQLKAIGASFVIMSAEDDIQFIVLIATIFIALFAIYFGTKQTDVTEYRRGLMLAIAFESIVKLIALGLIAFIAYQAWQNNTTAKPFIESFTLHEGFIQLTSFTFWAQTFMAAAAIICLPRQFHVAIIDNLDVEHLRTARWLFPLYLLAIAVMIPIIAIGGNVLFNDGSVNSDNFVLAISVFSENIVLQVIVFLGGLSAATAMIIVATLTLSTMLTNDVILPKLLPIEQSKRSHRNYSQKIRTIRRIVIGFVLSLSFIYQQQMTGSSSLSSIGLIAFSLVIQLLPAIVGGLYWKKGHAHGVYAGLFMGIVSWIFWLIIPIFNPDMSIYSQSEILTQGAVISLFANAFVYFIFSKIAPARLLDKIQAEAFVHPDLTYTPARKENLDNIHNSDLLTLLTTFMGQSRCDQLVMEFEKSQNIIIEHSEKPEQDFIAFCERGLGGVIGASSAQVLIFSILQGKKLDFSEVINFFDGTTQAMQFNMTALMTSLESMEHGISVIDKHLNLVAWNKKYVELFNYPEDYLTVGAPIEKLMRYNAVKGELGPGDVDELIKRRIEHLKNGSQHRFTRQRNDGKVIEMVGNPLPGGGFVTSFNDVTSHVEIQQALEEANIDLESRMKKRTEEVHSINADLRLEIERRYDAEKELIEARRAAEQANASKTRFLALASHDIIQPLNAAKLYLSALEDAVLSKSAREILTKLSDSVNSSEQLISTLLDISRLDQGDLNPTIEKFELSRIVNHIISDMSMKAENKGLELRSKVRDVWVKADKTYTYRIVQNFVSNAIKYTDTGKVLVTVKQDDVQVRIDVYDTGIGISEEHQAHIFDDFFRIQESSSAGVGLGLGVVRRLSDNMKCKVDVTSEKGKGSCFSLTLPATTPEVRKPSVTRTTVRGLKGLKVLCVDDKNENLDALKTLLDKWGVISFQANSYDKGLFAVDEFTPDLMLIDYQLDHDLLGLDLISDIQQKMHKVIPAAIVTALQDETLKQRCGDLGIMYLNKPLKPAKLRAMMQSMAKQQK